jgi:2-polyprenyl-3-methyl-5-hydroxy-6-metoxy-1,4-benzoquinol methylase
VDYRREYLKGELSLIRLTEPQRLLREASLFAHYRHSLRFLSGFSGRGRLLDIGRGSKVFPKLAADQGFDVHVVDSIPEATEYGREVFGLDKAVTGTIDDLPQEWAGFDFVTCFEVLEHVGQPLDLSRRALQLLAPGGYFLVSAPNRNRLSVQLGRRDTHDFPPNHLTRWTKDVLALFLRDSGFVNANVKTDGVERRDLTAILMPASLNARIVRRKISELAPAQQDQPSLLAHSHPWRLAQSLGDAVAAALNAAVGRRWGAFLVAFAQKPLE